MKEKNEVTTNDIHQYSQSFINDFLAKKYWPNVYIQDGTPFKWSIPVEFHLEGEIDEKKSKNHTVSFGNRRFLIKTTPQINHEVNVVNVMELASQAELNKIKSYSQSYINDQLALKNWGPVYLQDGSAYKWRIPFGFQLCGNLEEKKSGELTATFQNRFFAVKVSPRSQNQIQVDEVKEVVPSF